MIFNNLIRALIKFLEKIDGYKPFQCGGNGIIEFTDGKHRSRIFYRQPTSKERLEFAHAALKEDRTVFENIEGEITPLDLQLLTREKKLHPFAEKVITGWEGYTDRENKGVRGIDLIKEYFAHHLDTTAIMVFDSRDTAQKKN